MRRKSKVEKSKGLKVERLRASVQLARRTEDAIYAALRAGWPRSWTARIPLRLREALLLHLRAAVLTFAFCLFPFSLFAQFTQVSGTITDPNGVPYGAAVVTADLVASGSPTLNGAQCCASTAATTRSNGAFTMTLADNGVILPGGSQWRFTVSLSPGVLPPLGTGPQSFSVTLTITGATQSISAQLTAAAPALTQGSFGGGAVSSVFGRTGAVAATKGDYDLTDLGDINSPSMPGVQGNVICNLDGTNFAPCQVLRVCEIVVGDPGAASPALADDNDTPSVCSNKSGLTQTITAVECFANAGSPTVTPIITGGAATSILTGALTCGTGTFATGTLNGTPTLSNNGTIDGNITTAGGTAKYIVIRITKVI